MGSRMPSCCLMPRIGKGECLWGKCIKPRAARLMPAGLCQGFAGRSSPAGTLRALLILPSLRSASASAPGGAARSACPLHVAAMQPRAARPVRACERPVWPRHGFAVAREGRSPWVRLAAHGGPRRGAGNRFRGRSPFLDCPSEPPIAAQSLDGGGLRPAPLRSACNASCQRAGLRLKAAPCGRFLMLARPSASPLACRLAPARNPAIALRGAPCAAIF